MFDIEPDSPKWPLFTFWYCTYLSDPFSTLISKREIEALWRIWYTPCELRWISILIHNDPLGIQSTICQYVFNIMLFPAIEFWRWLSLKFTMFSKLLLIHYRFCVEGWWNSFSNCNDILVTTNWGIEDESGWDEPGCHNMSNHQERKNMLFNFHLFKICTPGPAWFFWVVTDPIPWHLLSETIQLSISFAPRKRVTGFGSVKPDHNPHGLFLHEPWWHQIISNLHHS